MADDDSDGPPGLVSDDSDSDRDEGRCVPAVYPNSAPEPGSNALGDDFGDGNDIDPPGLIPVDSDMELDEIDVVDPIDPAIIEADMIEEDEQEDNGVDDEDDEGPPGLVSDDSDDDEGDSYKQKQEEQKVEERPRAAGDLDDTEQDEVSAAQSITSWAGKRPSDIARLLVHVNSCTRSTCTVTDCNSMKISLAHSQSTHNQAGHAQEGKPDMECNICWQIWPVLHRHASNCGSLPCTIPMCSYLRLALNRDQEQLLIRQREMEAEEARLALELEEAENERREDKKKAAARKKRQKRRAKERERKSANPQSEEVKADESPDEGDSSDNNDDDEEPQGRMSPKVVTKQQQEPLPFDTSTFSGSAGASHRLSPSDIDLLCHVMSCAISMEIMIDPVMAVDGEPQ
jgi:hypothetical protein